MRVFYGRHAKPPAGEKCNGCGYCCAVQPCELAREFLGVGSFGACPALQVLADQSTACGLVQQPYYYLALRAGNEDLARSLLGEPQTQQERELGSEFAQSLGVGMGCDSADLADSMHWPWPVQLMQVQAAPQEKDLSDET